LRRFWKLFRRELEGAQRGFRRHVEGISKEFRWDV
jgi:hypothetical protein